MPGILQDKREMQPVLEMLTRGSDIKISQIWCQVKKKVGIVGRLDISFPRESKDSEKKRKQNRLKTTKFTSSLEKKVYRFRTVLIP